MLPLIHGKKSLLISPRYKTLYKLLEKPSLIDSKSIEEPRKPD